MKKIDIQVQEVQRVKNKMNSKRPTLRHIIIKTPKVRSKHRILKVAREKQLCTRGVLGDCQLTSQQKLCKPGWYELIKMMKSKDL